MSYSSEVLADSPQTYYRFSSGAYTTDSSGNSHSNAGFSGSGGTQDVTGLLNGDASDTAVSGGGSAFITINSNAFLPGTGAFTIEAWIKLVNNSGEIYDAADNGNRHVAFNCSTGDMTLRLPTGNLSVSTTLTAGTTFHVAVTCAGASGTVKFYKNGVQVGTDQTAGAYTYTTTLSSQVMMGEFFFGYQGGFNGTLDEVAFYHTVLSGSRLLTHYNVGAGNATAAPSLVVATATVPDARINKSYLRAVLTDSPRVYYRMGDTGSSFVDSSGNGNTGTRTSGGLSQGVAGLLYLDDDKALTGSNSGGRVTVPNAAFDPGTSGSWTVEGWINVTSIGLDQWIYLAGNATDSQVQCKLNVTTGRMAAARQGSTFVSAPADGLSTGTTYHVAFVYDANDGKIHLYKNGVEIHSATPGTSPDSGAYNKSWIGSNVSTGTTFAGTIDEVALYHTALSAERIYQHYLWGATDVTPTYPSTVLGIATVPSPSLSTSSTLTPSVVVGAATVPSVLVSTDAYTADVRRDNPVSYYKLEEASGTNAADSSGNAHDGTHAGSPVFSGGGGINTGTSVQFGTSSSKDARCNVPAAAFAPGTGDFSIECWVKVRSLAVTSAICDFRDDAFNRIDLQINTDGSIRDIDYLSITTGAGSIVVDTWYHVVETVTGGTGKIYLNGVLKATATRPAYAGVAFTTSVLAGTASFVSGLRGDLDEVAFYHTALSGARVLSHYNIGSGSTSAQPSTVVATASVPSPTIQTSATVTPARVIAVATILSPSVNTGGELLRSVPTSFIPIR